MRKALIDGDDEAGVVPIGEVVGRINDTPSCSELIERIVGEAEDTIKGMQKY